MRIVAGALRGRPLIAPVGVDTRPTSDRARQALFDVLAHAPWAPDLEDARVIDLFAGSGGLGLEALSRGASFCLFVETGEAARGAIRDNIESFGLFGETRIHRRDATDLGARPASIGGAFDLALLDPPYRKGLGIPALASLKDGGWLTKGAIAVLEQAADEPEPSADSFEVIDDRTWGAARVWFLRTL